MNTNKKLLLFLSLCIGHIEVNCSQPTGTSISNRTQQRPAMPSMSNSYITPISEEQMRNAIAIREKNANKNYNDIEYHANQLVQQNYKTDSMKYDILLCMNQLNAYDNLSQQEQTQTQENGQPAYTHTKQAIPFMQVNIATASIENLPTIFQILEKTTGTDPKNMNRTIIINGLQATLRAINGAIADIKYDKKYILASKIEIRLRDMQKQIENRIQELNPISWLKISLGIGSLATVAAVAGAYYSGITMKDLQKQIPSTIQQYADLKYNQFVNIINLFKTNLSPKE